MVIYSLIILISMGLMVWCLFRAWDQFNCVLELKKELKKDEAKFLYEIKKFMENADDKR